ncbi:MAG TPA: PSD1 and planctomycete cytochrome C domain-containing protein [Planctomycetota bacterium]|nr:PSD1 and planctomycete cytochrome C domain-containing protein [Planctomycetota bacterium]
MILKTWRIPAGVAALLCAAVCAGEPTPEQLDFFEKKIRPLLVNTCYECHSLEKGKSKGGLTLDTREGLLKGGISGPALVAGDPEKSLLFKAVRGDDPDAVMPPKGPRLSKDQLVDLEHWIKTGAADPRSGTAPQSKIAQLFEEAKTHWSFQPVKEPALPVVNAKAAVRSPIDAFLLAKLEEKKLSFAPRADKRTLIRRAYLDLHGLPPTSEEIAAFVADASPDAFEKLIERLLESPRYGERWGRHWLDVARYADTMGAIFGGDDNYPYAYSYRDYVIQAFNEDKPYDRFIQEQLAGDYLAKEDDNRALAAMGFLTLGRRKDRAVDDEVYDDRIDTISRGLLGLTVSCARCHDHKLEPITAKDYYALYAVLRSCKEPDVPPEIKPAPATPEYQAFLQERAKLRKTFIETAAKEAEKALDACRLRAGEYLLAMSDGRIQKTTQNNKLVADLLKPRKLNDQVYNLYIDRQKKWFDANKPVFALLNELLQLKDDEREEAVPVLAGKHAADAATNPRLSALLNETRPNSMQKLADVYTQLFKETHEACRTAAEKALAEARGEQPTDADLSIKGLESAVAKRLMKAVFETKLENAALDGVRAALNFNDAPTNPNPDNLRNGFHTEESVKAIDKVASPLKELEKKHPGAPPRAMALLENKVYDGKVFLRGNPSTQGEPAPRKFLEVLGGKDRPAFPKDKSGRFELAQAITAPTNPLTARVMVNRVWGWHFGQALVRTPSDFGLRGEAPTHPELLDYLATTFVREGWSIKKLHRLIMRSAAYQQSSTAPAEVVKADPENKLLARMNGRMLEFEAFRDAQLAVAGRLDLKAGGRAVDVTRTDKDSLRRTTYGLVDRKSLPNLFRNFDFPDPNFSASHRSRTALTPQALFLLNSGFIVDNARALASKVNASKDAGTTEKIQALYQLILQRPARDAELQRAAAFIEGYPQNDVVRPEATDWQYGRGTFDIASNSVRNFMPLVQYTGKAWQMPDKALGALALSAEGGEPGKGTDADAIRRWTAPLDGKVRITGELNHSQKEGDGIIARVIRNGTQVLGDWPAKNKGVTTALENIELKKGDTLDFIVSGGKDPSSDKFQWAPMVTMVTAEMPGMPGMKRIWDAKTDFMDIRQMPKPLTAWEELAQVLLLSNEFSYAD